MKIYYFNDSKRPVNLYHGGIGEKHFLKTLGGIESTVVDVDVPEGCIPYIKNWGSYVMFSYMINSPDLISPPDDIA